jgi:hypothetical protein
MGVIVPTGYGQLSLFFRQDGGTKQYVTTLGFNWGGSPPVSLDIEDIVDALTSTGAPFATTQMIDEYHLSGWRHSYETGTGPLVLDSAGGDIVDGTRTGSPLPVNVALLVRKGTGAGGRRGRGRNYIPPMWFGEAECDGNGVLDGTRYDAVNAVLATGLGNLSLISRPPFLFHSDGGTPDEITSWTLQPVVATQRRRLRR